MKILFLTEGGKNIGFGHITRCIALSDGFRVKKINSYFLINGDKTVIELLKGKKYKLFNWIKNTQKTFEILKNYDFVVIDSYLAPKKLYDKISEIKNGKLLMIDDYRRIIYPPGIVVNPSIYGDKLKYPKTKGVKYLLGPKYIILRKEFWNVPKKKINRKIKNILVTFGGASTEEFINKIGNFIRQNFKSVKIYVVNPNKKKLTAKQMLKLMLKADLCISGGGQTLYELARVGVPTIGICFADNQLLNLKYFEKYGFLKFAGWYDEKDVLSKLLNKIRETKKIKDVFWINFNNHPLLLFIREIIYISMLRNINIRKVKNGDVWDIYKISNDPLVRKNSFNSKKITKKEHANWFKNLDKDKFFVAQYKDKIVAQVRFKETKEGDIISISLDSEYRGFGLSDYILNETLSLYQKKFSKKKIIAYIKQENISSVKLFEKVGFKKVGLRKINSVLAHKYVYE
ncbi:MAG: GNAT family N-acetyltransferase [Elusimicrobia bacterium]|nr:GNAT family N-acetyltransferase [Elusimicrobiota bacterium]